MPLVNMNDMLGTKKVLPVFREYDLKVTDLVTKNVYSIIVKVKPCTLRDTPEQVVAEMCVNFKVMVESFFGLGKPPEVSAELVANEGTP